VVIKFIKLIKVIKFINSPAIAVGRHGLGFFQRMGGVVVVSSQAQIRSQKKKSCLQFCFRGSILGLFSSKQGISCCKICCLILGAFCGDLSLFSEVNELHL
jgi:hypothetical protein